MFRIERIAIQVGGLDDAVQLVTRLFEGEVWRTQFEQPTGERLRLAFHPAGIELLEVEDGADHGKGMHLRSFHVRVPNLAVMRRRVVEAGGTVESEFTLGRMQHMVCRISGLRLILVEYEGSDGMAALRGMDNPSCGAL